MTFGWLRQPAGNSCSEAFLSTHVLLSDTFVYPRSNQHRPTVAGPRPGLPTSLGNLLGDGATRRGSEGRLLSAHPFGAGISDFCGFLNNVGVWDSRTPTYSSVYPLHVWIPNGGVDLEQQGQLKQICVYVGLSRSSVLFRVRCISPPSSEPGPRLRSLAEGFAGWIGSHPSMPFSLDMWACHSWGALITSTRHWPTV